jgi:hypothetical protein
MWRQHLAQCLKTRDVKTPKPLQSFNLIFLWFHFYLYLTFSTIWNVTFEVGWRIWSLTGLSANCTWNCTQICTSVNRPFLARETYFSWVNTMKGSAPPDTGLQKRETFSTLNVGLAGTGNRSPDTCVASSSTNHSAIHLTLFRSV